MHGNGGGLPIRIFGNEMPRMQIVTWHRALHCHRKNQCRGLTDIAPCHSARGVTGYTNQPGKTWARSAADRWPQHHNFSICRTVCDACRCSMDDFSYIRSWYLVAHPHIQERNATDANSHMASGIISSQVESAQRTDGHSALSFSAMCDRPNTSRRKDVGQQRSGQMAAGSQFQHLSHRM